MDPVSLFRAFSDTTRLRLLFLLIHHEELCVCELTHVLGLPQPRVSHHLAALRKAKLVSDRKEGLWIYYRLNPALPLWVVEVLHTTAEGVSDDEPYSNDEAALREMSRHTGDICST